MSVCSRFEIGSARARPGPEGLNAARTYYENVGFREVYRYHYRVLDRWALAAARCTAGGNG